MSGNELTVEEKKAMLLAKHKPLTAEETRLQEIEAEAAREKYQKDIQKVEENLTTFLLKEDPLVDPGSDKAIAWLRRLPYKELTGLFPDDLRKEYEEGGAEAMVRLAENEEYKYFLFDLMEKMISKPEYTAEEWSEKANLTFINLFNARVSELMGLIEEQTSFL